MRCCPREFDKHKEDQTQGEQTWTWIQAEPAVDCHDRDNLFHLLVSSFPFCLKKHWTRWSLGSVPGLASCEWIRALDLD